MTTAPGGAERRPSLFAPLAAAFTFLTRLPLPGAAEVDAQTLARSSAWFPVVGAAVGGLGGLALVGASHLWTPFVASVLAVLTTVLVTGGFHEDALADAADGLGGGWTRERVLEIMSDSRIGAYGAVALVLVLTARIGSIAAMSPLDGARALVGAHVLARWSSLPLIRLLPYARAQGSGRPFAGAVTISRLLAGTLLASLLVAAALGRHALPAGIAAAVVTGAAVGYFRARLGGVTGDCLGATNQIVELVTYLVVLV
jgi:adenosylcobinamide-GDP ribazoletransferase